MTWLTSVERFPPALALLKENLRAEAAAATDYERTYELGGPVVTKEQVHADIVALKKRSAERLANDLEAKAQAEELRREALAEQKRKGEAELDKVRQRREAKPREGAE